MYRHVQYSVPMNNLRSVQRDPDHPEAQLHTPGDVQAPPFAQAGVQMAGPEKETI